MSDLNQRKEERSSVATEERAQASATKTTCVEPFHASRFDRKKAQVEFVTLVMAAFHSGDPVPGLCYCAYSLTWLKEDMLCTCQGSVIKNNIIILIFKFPGDDI